MTSGQTVRANKMHQQWDRNKGWKSSLNNLRLIIQPTLTLWLLSPWLDIFPNRNLLST
jgi:hypothetical protein